MAFRFSSLQGGDADRTPAYGLTATGRPIRAAHRMGSEVTGRGASGTEDLASLFTNKQSTARALSLRSTPQAPAAASGLVTPTNGTQTVTPMAPSRPTLTASGGGRSGYQDDFNMENRLVPLHGATRGHDAGPPVIESPPTCPPC